MRIHIVMGNAGMYKDYTTWVEAVCSSKKTADAICERLNAQNKSIEYIGTCEYDVEHSFKIYTSVGEWVFDQKGKNGM